jgi:DNA helicase IV
MASFQFRLPPRASLTRLQRLAIDDDNPIITTGVPGSGKTVVAIYRLARLQNNSKLFTYTRMLTVAIKGAVNTNIQNVSHKVGSVYEWFGSTCKIKLSDIIGNENEIRTVLNDHDISFDEIIFDEGQDLPISLYRAIKDHSNRISIGADNAQQVFSNGSDEDELTEVFFDNNQHELDQNHRNTFEIFNFARHFVPDNDRAQNEEMLERLSAARRGDEPIILIYNSFPDMKNKLKEIISENIGGNIGILIPHRADVKKYYDIIKNEYKIECSYFFNGMDKTDQAETERNLQNVLITTFKSAKGMEFDTVILPELHLLVEELRVQYFVGSTRARANLFLLSEGDVPYLIRNDSFDDSYSSQTISATVRDNSFLNEDDLPF